ncbi:MAG: prepilin-type N-terminal cleavage/methylation domain-containing protein [Candidatus Gracilibacteria bacterium]|nr:prepilin-type N-terminal cleavage/methylation domain-containing protein [Candidatus Gracilibacteria bacterium]
MNRKKGFTLIELMISITIMAVLTMISYAPYSYYQNKASLKVTAREVSQILSEARNMAINGAVGNEGNVSIGVYFDTIDTSNNMVKVFSFPHDIDKLNISYLEGGSTKLIKTVNLTKGIIIDDIDGKQNLLFLFDSITGNITYYTWVGSNREDLVKDNITINFSYKGSTSPNLNKTINYYTKTNIIDY